VDVEAGIVEETGLFGSVDVVVVSSGVSRSSSSPFSDLVCLAALDAGGAGSDTDTTSDAPTADAIELVVDVSSSPTIISVSSH